MLTPQEIFGMAERKYPAFLQSLITGESIFPLRIRFGIPKSTTDLPQLIQEVTALNNNNFGYTIEWETRQTRKHGPQQLPSQIRFDTEQQFIEALRKQTEVARFKTNRDLTLAALPQLHTWLAAHVKWLVEFQHLWPELLLVCQYFLAHPRPNLYTRELPIAVHTKFIQENTKVLSSLLEALLPDTAKTEGGNFEARFGLKSLQPLVRFRTLDPALRHRLDVSHADMGLPLPVFCQLPATGLQVIITENLMNFECLPEIPNSLAVWGQGNAAELLLQVKWLANCHVYYWGDIDEHGFHILARLRSKFPSIRSLMMDPTTLQQCKDATGLGEKAGKAPVNLTIAEHQAYEAVASQNLRLEQEKIPQAIALTHIHSEAEHRAND
jgi:hypothetical protein